MGKLKEAQERMEESKKKLDSITVEGKAEGVTVVSTANKEIKNIDLSDEFIQMTRKEQEDEIVLAVNNALKEATKVSEVEMQSTAKGILPNMPGMF